MDQKCDQAQTPCRAFMPATPVSIPSRRSQTQLQTPETIYDLLERTRIPRKFSKPKRKSSSRASSIPSLSCSPESTTSARKSSLFESDPCTPSQSLPSSHSFLLTPPSSIPELCRSYSSNSLESELSVESSQYARSLSRLCVPSRVEIDPDTDNPLATTPEDDFEFGYNMSETPSAGPTRRRSSLGMLLRPFKAVSPSSMASSIVSALSTNLSSWAASMASTQYDDGYGLLSSLGDDSIRAPGSGLRRGSLHQGVPRPIRLSGPQKAHATIIDAEMERPLLVPEQKPVYVELAPWSSDVAANTLPAPPESRSREPRMNPDFLRILVLESNMRKLGKISETTGRARMILSPRCGDYRESRLRFSVSC